MARSETLYRTFNRGLISDLALARTDVQRTGLSAETMDNWMARRLGPMMLRPGTAYVGGTLSDNKARYLPFIYSFDDKALLELTGSTLRVWLNDSVVTRSAVLTTIAESDFATLTNWTDNDEMGGTSQVTSVGSVDYLELEGDGTNAAIRTQQVSIPAAYQSTEHGFKIEVGMLDYTTTGNLSGLKPTLRIGTSDGDDDLIAEVELDNGNHHFAFTPGVSDIWIQFSNRQNGSAFVRTCEIESSGDLSITTLWAEADLPAIRYDQSGNVLYASCGGCPPCKIIRHTSDSKSWAVVLYEPPDGPFGEINTGPITITPSALSGEVTLTASGNFWKSSDVGRLVKVVSNGQSVSASISAENTFTNTIKVTGASNARIFQISRSGTWTATVTLQRSVTAEDSGFTDVTTYTSNATITYDDGLDNQIAWYRIGIKTGDYTSGTAELALDYSQGGIEGVARIYLYTSATVVSASTLTDFGSTDAQEDWYLGSWSTRSGFPSAVAFFEGRLAWAGKSMVWLTESDAYESFDDNTEGDSKYIRRTLGSGPVDNINWMLAAEHLFFGTDGAENVVRSSGDDEILTPSNANIRDFSSHGSARVQPARHDSRVMFIERNGTRLMAINDKEGTYTHETNDLTALYPEAGGDSKIVHVAIQRQPDTRVHCVRADGTVAILVYDPVEGVSCWLTVSLGGTDTVVEDAVILPGDDGDPEDKVYYAVKRTVNSSTVRYLERWALESECQGGTQNKNLDSHITGTVSSGIMTGFDHLEGETIKVWSNGVDAGSYTVSGGQITGVTDDGSAVAGLSYTAQWKSTKLPELMDKKNVAGIGFMLKNTHYQGLTYGPNFTDLDELPLMKDEALIADDTVHSEFHEETMSFNGNWDVDSRVCLQAQSPRPCTILLAAIEVEL